MPRVPNAPISNSAIRNAFMMDAPKPRYDATANVAALHAAPKPRIRPRKAPKATLSAYKPSLGEKIQLGIARGLGGLGVDERYAHHFAGRAVGALNDATPVGDAISFDTAKTEFKRGNYGAAAGNAAMGAIGAIPGAGDLAAKGLRHLEFPSQLNRPRGPTLEEMQRLSSLMDVPLSQARLGNKLEWDQYGKNSPWLDEYADNPIAARLENGEYVLVDGNHRTTLALREGRETMPMHVIPAKQYDPQNAGRAPAPSRSREDLDLLAALLGGD